MEVAGDGLNVTMKQAVGHRGIEQGGRYPAMKKTVIALESGVGLEARISDVVTNVKSQPERLGIVLAAQQTVTVLMSETIGFESVSGHRYSHRL